MNALATIAGRNTKRMTDVILTSRRPLGALNPGNKTDINESRYREESLAADWRV